MLLTAAPVLTPTDEIDLSQPDWDQDLRDYWRESILALPTTGIADTIQTVLTPVVTGTVTLEEGTPEATEAETPEAMTEETPEAELTPVATPTP